MSSVGSQAGPSGNAGVLVSPLARADPAAGRAGSYPHERDNVAALRFAEGSRCAGLCTRHDIGATPVDWCKTVLARTGGEGVCALIVNAGCANSVTGAAGTAAVERAVRAAADGIGFSDNARADGLDRHDRRRAG